MTISTLAAEQAADTQRQARNLLLMLLAFAFIIHSGFLFYDLVTNFDPFLRADRSSFRFDLMSNLLNARSWGDIRDVLIGNDTIIGEYILQAVLSSAGGVLGVIVFQIALQIASIVAVFRIGRLTLLSPRLSFAAALIYATLPHSLILPHQLSTEAIAIPLLVIGYWFFLEYRVAEKSFHFLFLAGLMLGFAACVRPVLLLIPIMLLPFVPRKFSYGAMIGSISFAVLGLAPVLLWSGFVFSATHQLSLNPASPLGVNVYYRAVRIAELLASENGTSADRYLRGYVEERCAVARDRNTGCTMSMPSYASFIVHYPLPTFQFFLQDTIMFGAKSGVSRATMDYFNLAHQDRDEIIAPNSLASGWRAIWDNQGPLEAIHFIATKNPAVVMVELAGGLAFSVFFLLFLIGLAAATKLSLDRKIPIGRRVAFIILALQVVYTFASLQIISEYIADRYRYPAEFAMCVIAVLGGATMSAFFHSRRAFWKRGLG